MNSKTHLCLGPRFRHLAAPDRLSPASEVQDLLALAAALAQALLDLVKRIPVALPTVADANGKLGQVLVLFRLRVCRVGVGVVERLEAASEEGGAERDGGSATRQRPSSRKKEGSHPIE